MPEKFLASLRDQPMEGDTMGLPVAAERWLQKRDEDLR